MRQINIDDISDIARGAAILGSGGGGNPYMGKLIAERAIKKYGPVSVVSAHEVEDDAVIISMSIMGAPTVFQEKILSGTELINVITEIVRTIDGKPIYLINCEIGGVNATTAIAPAAQLGIPLVDGDLTSRAFPEIHMQLPNLLGMKMIPLVLADEKGNVIKIDAINYEWGEKFCRSVSMVMGGTATLAVSTLSGKDIKDYTAHGTLLKAQLIGRAAREAREKLNDPIEAIASNMNGKTFYIGKIVDVERKLVDGFIRGSILIDGEELYFGKQMKIDFQNEYLVAYIDSVPIVTTPDLICVIERSTGEALPADVIRYGSKVAIITAIPDERWCTEQGLKIVGPKYFGYDCEYKSLMNEVV